MPLLLSVDRAVSYLFFFFMTINWNIGIISTSHNGSLYVRQCVVSFHMNCTDTIGYVSCASPPPAPRTLSVLLSDLNCVYCYSDDHQENQSKTSPS